MDGTGDVPAEDGYVGIHGYACGYGGYGGHGGGGEAEEYGEFRLDGRAELRS